MTDFSFVFYLSLSSWTSPDWQTFRQYWRFFCLENNYEVPTVSGITPKSSCGTKPIPLTKMSWAWQHPSAWKFLWILSRSSWKCQLWNGFEWHPLFGTITPGKGSSLVPLGAYHHHIWLTIFESLSTTCKEICILGEYWNLLYPKIKPPNQVMLD